MHHRCFATCSRDHTVKLWALDATAGAAAVTPLCALPQFPCPVTAVALAPAHVCRRAAAAAAAADEKSEEGFGHVCAVGLEDGGVELWAAGGAAPPQRLWACPPGGAHAAAVRRLAWAPGGGGGALLASCGEDHAVRVYAVEPSDTA